MNNKERIKEIRELIKQNIKDIKYYKDKIGWCEGNIVFFTDEIVRIENEGGRNVQNRQRN